MNPIFTALYEVLTAAKAQMPTSMPPAASVDMLLTLLFWKLMSGYLNWFMNSSITYSHINNYPSDRTSRVISPAVLAGLKVVVPSPDRQQMIL